MAGTAGGKRGGENPLLGGGGGGGGPPSAGSGGREGRPAQARRRVGDQRPVRGDPAGPRRERRGSRAVPGRARRGNRAGDPQPWTTGRLARRRRASEHSLPAA